MKVAIAGTGYVGLVTGVCLAEHNHEVTCVDVDIKKVETLQKGICPIYESGLEELMKKNSSRLSYTTDYKNAYKNADVIFIGVGTPEKLDGSANLQYVYDVARQIAEFAEKDCIVVIKSTVPIGTNDKIESYIKDNQIHPIDIFVASNPEFLSQGTAVHDTLFASRIVIGVENKKAEETLLKMYDSFSAPKLITNRRSAEMIKYASNDFLALKISYINEIANLCEIVGANIEDVTAGMGYDSRIGNKFLKAGIGYGGSCFPKDTKALSWLASFNDYELKTVKSAIEVNEQQKLRLLKKARKYYENFKGITVAVLGLTFKPGTDDLREAPSLVNIPLLLEDGAKINVWDPIGMERFKTYYNTGIQFCPSIEQALDNAQICFIFTEWEEIKTLSPDVFLKHMVSPILLDGRNCFETQKMLDAGIIYESIGR